MNALIAQLLAALAAFAVATGSPVDANKLPDRPAIVQLAPGSSKNVVSNSTATNSTKPSDDKNKSIDNSTKVNRVEIHGTITSIKTNDSTTTIIVGNQTVSVDSKTRLEGKLEVGAKVQIEAFKQANGSLIASQVEAKRDDATVKSSDDKDSKTKTDDSKDVKKDDGSGTKSGGDDTKSDAKSDSGTSGDEKSGSNSSGDSKSGNDSDDPSGHK